MEQHTINKFKKVVISTSILLLVITIYLSIRLNTVKIYLNMAYPSSATNVSLKMGNNQLLHRDFQDHSSKIEVMEKDLKLGIYTVVASTKDGKLTQTKKIFVCWDRFISIQYHPKDNKNSERFEINTSFSPL